MRRFMGMFGLAMALAALSVGGVWAQGRGGGAAGGGAGGGRCAGMGNASGQGVGLSGVNNLPVSVLASGLYGSSGQVQNPLINQMIMQQQMQQAYFQQEYAQEQQRLQAAAEKKARKIANIKKRRADDIAKRELGKQAPSLAASKR